MKMETPGRINRRPQHAMHRVSTLLVLLLVTAATVAEPSFEIGAGAGDGLDPIGVRIFFDGDGEPTESGGMSFSFDATQLQGSAACALQVGDPQPDRIFFSHRVNCQVDNLDGSVSVSFSPLFIGATLSRRIYLGQIFFDVDPSFVPAPQGSTFQLSTTSVNLPNSDGRDGGNGSLMVVRGWPLDAFESDDEPTEASKINESSVGQARPSPFSPEHLVQARSFDVPGDEDWVFFEQTCPSPPPTVDVRVSPLAPFSPQHFRPVLEIYPVERLTDETILPLETLGSCESPTSADLVAEGLDFEGSRLLRLRNCVDPPESAVNYSLRISLLDVCLQSQVTRYLGTVRESGTGFPVQVFLRSDANIVSASDSSTGEYQIFGFGGEPIEIEVVSDQYRKGPFLFDELPAGISRSGFDIEVTRTSEQVFSSGFEPSL